MRKDLLSDYELFDGIDRDLFPEYDKTVELIIERKPNLFGEIPDQKKNERYFRWLSKGIGYHGAFGIIGFSIPLFLFFGYLLVYSEGVTTTFFLFIFFLCIVGGFLFGITFRIFMIKSVKKYMSEYVSKYNKMPSQTQPDVDVQLQSNVDTNTSDDKYSQLDKIAQLKERGVLNKREFEKEKHKILNK